MDWIPVTALDVFEVPLHGVVQWVHFVDFDGRFGDIGVGVAPEEGDGAFIQYDTYIKHVLTPN